MVSRIAEDCVEHEALASNVSHALYEDQRIWICEVVLAPDVLVRIARTWILRVFVTCLQYRFSDALAEWRKSFS